MTEDQVTKLYKRVQINFILIWYPLKIKYKFIKAGE